MEPEALLGGKFGILFLDQFSQLMRGVMGAVDDALRQAPQAGHGFPFRSQGLGDGFPVRQGVLPAGLAEPPDEGFFICIQEDEVEFEPLALQAVEDPGVILRNPWVRTSITRAILRPSREAPLCICRNRGQQA